MSFKSCFSCEKGATAIEYTMIAAGVSMAIMAAVFLFGDDMAALYDSISAAFAG